MRFILALLVFMAATAHAVAQGSMKDVERLRTNGADYVRVKDWCRVIGFVPRWGKPDEELQVTNKSWRINLTINSIKSRVNGLDVRLSLPVISRNGWVWISLIDVQTTIHPLIYGPKRETEKLNVICIDPGHGGRDAGKIDKRNYEKTYTLLLANELTQLLKKEGFKVILTRTKDQTLDLEDRAAIANRSGAQLFISLHYNSAENRSVYGVETYCMTPAGVDSSNSGGGASHLGHYGGNDHNDQNMLLAYEIQRSLVKTTRAPDRGVKRARWIVLRDLKMPAVLIEAGFMSNSDEAKKIYDSAYRKKTAEAILAGIKNYKAVVDPLAR